MDAMGLVGLALGVLAIAGLVVLLRAGRRRRTRREEETGHPGTVAELVQLRAAQQAVSESSKADPAPMASADPPVQSEGEPEPRPEPDVSDHAEPLLGNTPPVAGTTPAESKPTIPQLPATLPEPEMITVGTCGPSPVSPPWARVPDGSLTLPTLAAPEQPVERAVVESDRMGPPAWRRFVAEGGSVSLGVASPLPWAEPAAESRGPAIRPDDELAGWADWAEVDTDEDDARREAPSPTDPPLSFGPTAVPDSGPANSGPSSPGSRDAAVGHPAVEAKPTNGAAVSPDLAANPPTATDRPVIGGDEPTEVDQALLRTLGFPDPSPRSGAADLAFAAPTALATEIEDTEIEAQPIRFRVIRRDSVPVPEATVTLLDGHGLEAGRVVSGADGRGVVEAPRPGGYVLVTSAPDHQPGAVAVTVEDAVHDVEVLLAGSGSLTGVVRTPSKTPVVGASVTLLQDGEIAEATQTDATGGYRLGDLAAGEYTLAVTTAQYDPMAVVVQVREASVVEQDIVLSSGRTTAEPGSATDG
ncbi:carboxypeptidase regulatory-like domain-containing protein [Pseudonocardia hispaniensis]|uniref:Carboxypeptidase regulatory-like domain-containing protein n=1 Tax=Pseudonocardia hispaniensis TaxID=904933 RepID=A0ABW1J4Q9_9PSEU